MTDDIFPMILAGEDEIQNERELLRDVQGGMMMNGAQSVRFIVVHCSGTRANSDYTAEQLKRDHLARGFRTVGYHFYIRRSGDLSQHRRLLEVGAHAKGYNRCSVGVCYEGGLDATGRFDDTRTPEQKRVLLELLGRLHRLFPQAIILGHRDLPGVRKACPCFDAAAEYIFG